MSIAALRDENEQLKALLAQTQAALSEHQGALAASEEARRRLEVILGELRLEKFGAKSTLSSTSWRLVRSTVAMLVSSAAAIRLSLQPAPASDTSAFKRIRNPRQQLGGTLAFVEAGLDLQTQHRRYARSPFDPRDYGAAGHGRQGARLRPAGMEQAKQVLSCVAYCQGPYECVEGADAAVIVTEWEQFRALDLGRVSDLMACPLIVDLRNVYRPEDMKKHGFAYTCVGRAPSHQSVGLYTPTGSVEKPSVAGG